MKKYAGIVSILVLVLTFLILQSLVGKMVGSLPYWMIGIGYGAAVFFSWYSTSGFWRKMSAAVLIVIPAGYAAVVVLFVIGLAGGGF